MKPSKLQLRKEITNKFPRKWESHKREAKVMSLLAESRGHIILERLKK
jgi:hypothetical protein